MLERYNAKPLRPVKLSTCSEKLWSSLAFWFAQWRFWQSMDLPEEAGQIMLLWLKEENGWVAGSTAITFMLAACERASLLSDELIGVS